MPRKTRGRRSPKRALTESVTEKTPPVLWQRRQVRLKRRGKSSPLAEQFARQEKPHAVQDKTEGGQPVRRSSGIVASSRLAGGVSSRTAGRDEINDHRGLRNQPTEFGLS